MAEAAGRRGLGRGLSALLGEADAEPTGQRSGGSANEESRPQEAPIERLRRNPEQPRRHFAEAEMEELSNSIRERGILQPILVRPAPGSPGEYQIVAGERRWRAAQTAGLHSVPILVRNLDDAEVAELSIIENVQRADLNPLEEAQGYRTLIDRFGRTQEALSRAVGKSRSHVANSLRLLGLPEKVREHLSSGRLSAGHARAIATAPDPDQLAKAIVDGDLSVRQAETLARQAHDRPQREKKQRLSQGSISRDADTRALEQDLSEIVGLRVEIHDKSGQGEVRIHYSSLEQLDEVCRRISAATQP